MPRDERPDMDSRQRVDGFVDAFYARMLADEVLAPIFVDVAQIDLAVHLPHIKAYWAKLLLGERDYTRHTMNIHRALHAKRSLRPSDFERWLNLFTATVDAGYIGPKAEQAKRVAKAIAGNMQAGLDPRA